MSHRGERRYNREEFGSIGNIVSWEAMMNMRRKIIEIDEAKCSGCGLCVAACAEGAIEITGGKARIVKENRLRRTRGLYR